MTVIRSFGRYARYGLWGAVMALGVPGCDRSDATQKKAEVAEDKQKAADPPAQPKPPRVVPQDLDVGVLTDKLDCSHSHSEACRVVAEFAEAKSWSWQTPAGEGRWVGNAFVVGKDQKETKDFMVLWVKQVPTATVDADLLPMRLGTGMLPEDLRDHRWKLVHAVKSNSAVSRRNRAQPVAVAFTPTEQYGVSKTQGASVVTFTEEKAFVRQAGRAVYYIRPSADPAAAHGEGTYAELWPVSW